MKKLSDDMLMDYVDGRLDATQVAAVEEYLQFNAEDAQLVADMKIAMVALRELEEVEPVRVSADFWPRLREKLPEKPQRSWLRHAGAQLQSWLAPVQSPWRVSVPIAVVAVFLVMATFLFAPKQSTHVVNARDFSKAEETFIQQSLNRHAAYDSSQPLSGSLPLAIGDGRSAEHGDEDDDDSDHLP
jgi:anti-sigma factor RsiW